MAARDVAHRGWLRLGACSTAALALAALVSAAYGSAPSRAATAHAAGTVSLNDTAHLHLTSHHSFTLNEQGSASGTIAGTIYIHLNVVSTNRVTAEVNLYPSGGSLTGYATAGYRPSGGVASFNGTMSVARGSGRYRGAHGSGLSFTGTIQRTNDAVTVHVSGRMST
ncbi:MAG TPA: autotransporter [Solirubrobacteraceae bacterium]|nr:autotransporter [Solirubrobacteraceae bacterium]